MKGVFFYKLLEGQYQQMDAYLCRMLDGGVMKREEEKGLSAFPSCSPFRRKGKG